MGVDRTTAAALADRARNLWEHLAETETETETGAGAEVRARFASAVKIAVSPRSRLCPPGWTGIVTIGGAALATAPDHETARRMQEALGGLPAVSLTDPAVLAARLPAGQFLGPAVLAYLDPVDFRPGEAGAVPLDRDNPELERFLLAADAEAAEDVAESGIREITTPAFAIREHGTVVAAAGYRDWPCGIAQLSVLTAELARGRGLARAAASAAVARALEEGKLPQWRARPEPSRRVARALGFRELGAQVSFRPSVPVAVVRP